MGVLGRAGCYLKNPAVALELSRVDTIVFDKTGTLTSHGRERPVECHGLERRRQWQLAPAPGRRVACTR